MPETPGAIVGSPAAPIAHARRAAQRVGFSYLTDAGSAPSRELDRVCLAIAGRFEKAAGRIFARRTAVAVTLSGCDHSSDEAIVIPIVAPVESVVSLHIDTVAEDPVDVVFDATTLIDPADYRLIAAPNDSVGAGWWALRIRRSVNLGWSGEDNIRLVVTGGYWTDPGDGTALPAGQVKMPEDLEEAALLQTALEWQRRSKIHIGQEAVQFAGGGGGQNAYTPTPLLRSVREVLAKYATANQAINLADGTVVFGGGQE